MADKIKRRLRPENIIMIWLGAMGVLLLLVSLFIVNGDIERIIKWIGYGLIWAAIIFKLFIVNPGFGYKPTREEIEKKQFDK